jgi:uncharacterized oligopeptide transporter (OPT) family protein
MALFQSPPRTPEELARSQPLDISPEQVLEMDEATWYERIYRGDDVPQLTVRAVAVGSALGFLLAFTNLYVGLKTGWGLGVAITACILAYALWNGLMAIGVAKTPLTILETNCMQSTASAAGYSTGSTIISAIAALLMLSATPDNPAGRHLPIVVLLVWTFVLAVFGCVIAIPMKRNMINRERLLFPSGTAAAVTLQSLYSRGEVAMRKARALLVSGVFGAVIPLLIELTVYRSPSAPRPTLLPPSSPLFDFLPARGTHLVDGVAVQNKPSDWNIAIDHNPVLIAAGAIVGLRISAWMFIGACLLAWVIGPYGAESPWVNPAGDTVLATTAPGRAWREIGLWLGVPILVSSGLLSFALQWRTIVAAVRGMAGGGGPGNVNDRAATVEVPMSWFAIGISVSGAAVVAVAAMFYNVPVHYGILAVIMTFALALVACRATGESDITPIGPLGKIMQLTYGVLIPQSVVANIMTAQITASSAASSADLLNDLKSGYLLGADPRRQFIAQLAGTVTGTIAMVGGFYVLVPDATFLNGVGDAAPKFPAPAAQAWKAVAQVFQHGIANMHPVHQQAIWVGLMIGAVLVLLEVALPKARKWLPSPTGLGLGMVIPGLSPVSFFLGALGAWMWHRFEPRTAETYVIPVASGIIAGVSIVGVVVAFLNNVVLAT